MESNKRDGGVGDIWLGLLGKKYQDRLHEIIQETADNGRGFKHGNNIIFIDESHAFDIHVLVQQNEEDDGLDFTTAYPVFDYEFEPLDYFVESIEEWSNEVEVVFDGEIFNGRMFGFYCTNYLSYKNDDLVGQTIKITPTVIGLQGNILPEEKRSFVVESGPFKGETMNLSQGRYLNPKTEIDNELCEFLFPIIQIETVNFEGYNIYKIVGSLLDENDKEFFFNVYINSSHIEDEQALKVGEPFSGVGWLQADIVDS